jgi:hypothetical protein
MLSVVNVACAQHGYGAYYGATQYDVYEADYDDDAYASGPRYSEIEEEYVDFDDRPYPGQRCPDVED